MVIAIATSHQSQSPSFPRPFNMSKEGALLATHQEDPSSVSVINTRGRGGLVTSLQPDTKLSHR